MLLLKTFALRELHQQVISILLRGAVLQVQKRSSLFCMLTNCLKESEVWVSLTSRSLLLWLFINKCSSFAHGEKIIKISLLTFSDFLMHFLILSYNLDPWSDLSFGKYHLWILWYSPHQRTGRNLFCKLLFV